ncbi:multidrug efflux MFS transporter [Loigolactobacillus backii]|uniref:Multidrug transporter n=1 Tax=Loigolactobacillus backii TaxID=375175 RepID=A0A192H2Y9_9LACO|nr:multidrug efflux MFS transporter [Loigolactobacillus backii]ANK62316.1 multidrug transporter [Loigolactobacillus backii]ANK70671.1 multidrug transporter [Loigolactobacillus backii]MDA5388976.1 multidrug efflux MFS transporter [Loigolactobacillus backii]MDA5391494.1 multidrug efflux MFS transporter [Loigolactobacillus backii]PIO82744.1 multidrug transporter subunit MdtG [Loigolactobacillus backii]
MEQTVTKRPRRPEWRQNLFILWFGCFMAGMGFSLVLPFMSLYIDTLGKFSTLQLNFWSGLTYSSTYLVTAVISPWWGQLADQKGRKLMLLRASAGMAIVLAAMGLVSNVYELIALRALQGVFSGFISNANALIATSAPREKSGQALGTLTTGSVSGMMLGPLLGGTIAGSFGYRLTFFITGGLLATVFFLCLFFVHETFTPVEKAKQLPAKQIFHELKFPHVIIGMFITTMIIQAANNSISPILSLFVRQLMHYHGNVALVSGIIASLPGIATLFAAPQFGKLGDRIGTERILIVGLIFAMCVYIPQTFVRNVWQLGALRLLVGISDAALLPAVQTLLAKYSPHTVAGRIFSYNQSFQSMGQVVGPLLGSSISGAFGYGGVFLSTSILEFVNLIWVWRSTGPLRLARKQKK